MLARVIQESQNIQPVAMTFGCPPEVEGKSLFLRTLCTLERHWPSAGTDLNTPSLGTSFSWYPKAQNKRPKEGRSYPATLPVNHNTDQHGKAALRAQYGWHTYLGSSRHMETTTETTKRQNAWLWAPVPVNTCTKQLPHPRFREHGGRRGRKIARARGSVRCETVSSYHARSYTPGLINLAAWTWVDPRQQRPVCRSRWVSMQKQMGKIMSPQPYTKDY